jgi:hypothetical protein
MLKNRYFLFLVTVLLSVESSASCASRAIRVWPSGITITVSPVFMIEGYMESRGVIRALNKKYPIYLISGNEIVKLEVTGIYEGAFRLTQALMKPVEKLTAGKKYELRIDSLDNYENISFEREKHEWIVSSIPDQTFPLWKADPRHLTNSYFPYGCGPAINATFCLCAQDDSPMLVHAMLKNESDILLSEYYLSYDDPIVNLGHYMCSGAFRFNEGDNYRVVFSLMDAAGNQNYEKTEGILFNAPSVADEGRTVKAGSCNCNTPLLIPFKHTTSYIICFCATFVIAGGFSLLIFRKRNTA